MSPEQCEKLFNRLMNSLKEYKLDWVRDQVAKRISQGKAIKKSVVAQTEWDSTNQGPRRRRKATFVGTEDFGPEERLQLVVQSIRHAVVATCDMQLEVSEGLASGDEPRVIHFYAEDEREPAVVVEPKALFAKLEALERLRKALEHVEREIENGD